MDQVVDERNVLPKLLPVDPSTHTLQYLDPYGDSIFNNLQMPRFLAEWELVEARAATSDERAVTAGIKHLAQYCLDRHHVYLKFVGD